MNFRYIHNSFLNFFNPPSNQTIYEYHAQNRQHELGWVNINNSNTEFGEFPRTPLMIAAHKNDYNAAKNLILSGANVNYGNDRGNTPLMVACETNSYQITKLLIDNGANVNQTNLDGSSAIHFAIGHSQLILKILIDNGADVNAISPNSGNTLLHENILNKSWFSAETLVSVGANIHFIPMGSSQTTIEVVEKMNPFVSKKLTLINKLFMLNENILFFLHCSTIAKVDYEIEDWSNISSEVASLLVIENEPKI